MSWQSTVIAADNDDENASLITDNVRYPLILIRTDQASDFLITTIVTK